MRNNSENKTSEIKQGWVVGISDANTTYDEGFGASNSNIFHFMIYQNQNFENFDTSINLGTFISEDVLKRKRTTTINSMMKNFYEAFGVCDGSDDDFGESSGEQD